MNPETPNNDPDDDAEDLGPSGRGPNGKRHPLYDNLAQFRTGEHRFPGIATGLVNRTVIEVQMTFPGGAQVYYARRLPTEMYDFNTEYEVARSACYDQLGVSVCYNTLPADPKAAVRNTRRRPPRL